MDDTKEIIFIALSNSLNYYLELLESNGNLTQDELDMSNYIISRHQELIDKFSDEISKEPEEPEEPIKPPSW